MSQGLLERQHSDMPLCQDWIGHSGAGGTFDEYLLGVKPGEMPEIEARRIAENARYIEGLISKNNEELLVTQARRFA